MSNLCKWCQDVKLCCSMSHRGHSTLPVPSSAASTLWKNLSNFNILPHSFQSLFSSNCWITVGSCCSCCFIVMHICNAIYVCTIGMCACLYCVKQWIFKWMHACLCVISMWVCATSFRTRCCISTSFKLDLLRPVLVYHLKCHNKNVYFYLSHMLTWCMQ